MRFVLYAHSVVSDWNNGNAHFLRGVCRALQQRGHRVEAYEPRDGWSRAHLLAEAGGEAALKGFRRVFSRLDKLDVMFTAFIFFAPIVGVLH